MRVEVVEGDFADTVDIVLGRLGTDIDLAFIDGFHRREATLDYHDGARPDGRYSSTTTSTGMKEAWERIESPIALDRWQG